MPRLIDTSLWIDLTRTRSPAALKELVTPHVNDPEACLAEPIIFELLRFATDSETRALVKHFETLPVLTTPNDLWSQAANLGQRCRKAGISAGAMDLIISTLAIHHDAELVTFDADFLVIARATDLRVEVVVRPRS
jgi:predicted nucleic acid-binding protein